MTLTDQVVDENQSVTLTVKINMELDTSGSLYFFEIIKKI
jgi:hypothetical protein